MQDERLKFQRDFYRLLLDMEPHHQEDMRDSLARSLELIVAAVGADHGYLEVQRESGDIVYSTHSLNNEEIDYIRACISKGIIAETLSSGEPVLTQSALFDPRFSTRESVQNAKIQAVLCVPLSGNVTRGVLYLQGDFLVDDEGMQVDARSFARYVSPLLDQLLIDDEADHSRSVPMAALREKYHLGEVVGSSDALYQALRSAMMVAPLAASVLLTGRSGTGKTQLAHVIHTNSGRAGRSFVEVNCAALPETLIENELFGAVRGAHSSATHDIEGKVGVADGGTLFLDEIGALPIAVQGKLLQFLQSGEYYPLGASGIRKSSARLVFATNSDLEAAVAEGTFRGDLYYRINTFPIRLPSLSERSEDIGELADALCRQICARHQFPPLTIDRQGKELLRSYDWPGNVRELSHHIESACIRAAFDEVSLLGEEQLRRGGAPAMVRAASEVSFQEATQAFQSSLIQEALAKSDGNVSEAARQLRISRTHLHHLINALGIRRDD